MNQKQNNYSEFLKNNDVYIHIHWVKENISIGEDGKYKAEKEAIDQISKTRNEEITNPLIMLYELVQHIDYLNLEIAKDKEEIENSRSLWERLFGTKDEELNKVKSKLKQRERIIEELSIELEKVIIEKNNYKAQCDEYDERLQRLLGEKAEERLDKNKHYKMTDSRPLDFQIDDDFEKLGKSLYGISN